ncbi:MAG: NAD-dependent epimerase/dehydratase family protein [Deltaproteobacteria bacterium]|nr:NAD-dependent epimerase/dehydratase family protein [Deltaproteobacteria bacterium]
MSTLITGATGYLGARLLRRLLDDGEQVRALVRDPNRLGIEHPNLEIVRGDMLDADSLARAVHGCARVYHAAAVVKEWVTDWSIFERVNVDAYETLLKICRSEGVERVVHTSSFMAIGQTDDAPGRIADETTEHEPHHHHNPYERTKYLAHLVTKKYVEAGVPIVTVNPGVIYGPGPVTEGNLVGGMIIDMTRHRFPGVPGNGKTRWCYAYVDDVVNGHVQAMAKGRVGERYILGGENVTLDEFVERAKDELGRWVPTMHLPLFLLMIGAHGMEQVAKLTGKAPMLTVGKVGVIKHNWAYSSAKAEQELGYAITPFAEGIRRTVADLRERGLVPPPKRIRGDAVPTEPRA